MQLIRNFFKLVLWFFFCIFMLSAGFMMANKIRIAACDITLDVTNSSANSKRICGK